VRIFVTGATGLLGNNIVRFLLERGDEVCVLTRPTSDPRPLKGLDVEQISGDLHDEAALRRAAQRADLVIHSAARVHIGQRDLAEQREVNVEGTRRVAAAALAAGARMVHISSVDALGAGRRDQPADEESPREGKPYCTYVVTKTEAERALLALVDQGLDAVIVNPGFMLGPWDWRPSSGRMLLEVARRAPLFAPTGGSSVTDVRDVAQGVLLAAARGNTGRRYILAGENISYFDQWRLFARIAGSRPPRIRMGPILRWFGGAVGDVRARITGRESDINSASIAMSSCFHYYSSARAETELGYRHRPAEAAARAAWEWFLEMGYAPWTNQAN
jgi:dihydroflavonol-4-reductase